MEIRKIEQITDEKWINLFAATFVNRGKEGRWVFASRRKSPATQQHACDAVIIVPILVEKRKPKKLVMIREFRIPAGGTMYGFPAGLLEEGETIEDTVRREMLEETGLEVVHVKKISPPLFSTSGLSDETAAVVFVDVKHPEKIEQSLDHSEVIEVVFLDYKAVCQLCDDPNARIDAKAWMSLYLYQQLGKLA